MSAQLLKTGLILMTLAALAAPPLVAGQVDKGTWDRERKLTRPVKKGRKTTRRHAIVQHAPLLTLEYRVMKQREDLTPEETNPQAVFYSGDRLQIRIKPNQDGYLYIIQSTDGGDGQIIFPDSRINNGRNLVKKNDEHTIPSLCDSRYRDNLGNCWFWMQPPAGREIFTVIFTRDAATDLDEVAGAGGVVKRQVIDRLLKASAQKINRSSRPGLSVAEGGGAGRYIFWVQNSNIRDNEELITEIVLLHQEHAGSD
jgi:hypothetical protein